MCIYTHQKYMKQLICVCVYVCVCMYVCVYIYIYIYIIHTQYVFIYIYCILCGCDFLNWNMGKKSVLFHFTRFVLVMIILKQCLLFFLPQYYLIHHDSFRYEWADIKRSICMSWLFLAHTVYSFWSKATIPNTAVVKPHSTLLSCLADSNIKALAKVQ